MKILEILVLLLTMLSFSYSQKQQNNIELETDAHAVLVQTAFELLLLDYPELYCSEMVDHIGYSWSGEGPWSEGLIKTGAVREDLEDVVFLYEGIFDWSVTISHFWKADNGDMTRFIYPVLVGYPYKNAYQKARTFIYGINSHGDINIYIHGNALADENVCVPSNRDGLYISYSSLFDFYNTGSYYVEGCRIGGFDYYLKCGPYTLSKDKRDLIVWEILGRVSHLLGDMGVPAHTHNDTHPGVDPDSYEDWMVSNNLIPYNQFEAYDVGGVIDVRLKNDPLRYLFYTTNQVAGYFASDDEGGDDNYNLSY